MERLVGDREKGRLRDSELDREEILKLCKRTALKELIG